MLKTLYKKAKKSKGGFTLIELIVVIAILAILAVVLVPTIGGQINKAKSAAADSDAQSVFMAAQLYQADVQAGNTTGKEIGKDLKGDSDSIADAGVSDMLASSEFKNITGQNDFKLTGITTDANGSVTSITMYDKNVGSATSPITYPKPTSSASSGG